MVGRGGSIIEVEIGQIGDLLFPVDSSRVGRMICSFKSSENLDQSLWKTEFDVQRLVALRLELGFRVDLM